MAIKRDVQDRRRLRFRIATVNRAQSPRSSETSTITQCLAINMALHIYQSLLTRRLASLNPTTRSLFTRNPCPSLIRVPTVCKFLQRNLSWTSRPTASAINAKSSQDGLSSSMISRSTTSQIRGMKVRSSVKKLCDACKVGGVLEGGWGCC